MYHVPAEEIDTPRGSPRRISGGDEAPDGARRDAPLDDHVENASTRTERTSPEHGRPRYAPWRFLTGMALTLGLAALAWPHIPRSFVAESVVILQPSLRGDDPSLAEPMRNPLDESAVLSELDVFGSSPLLDRVIAEQALEQDPEFGGRPPPGWGVALLERIGPLAPAVADVLRPTLEPEPPHTLSELRRTLHERIAVTRDRRSYTVRVGVRAQDPNRAATLTQSVVRAYLELQVARKRAGADGLAAHLTGRADALEAQAAASRAATLAFMDSSGLVDPGVQTSLEAQLATLSTHLANARAEAIDARTRADALAAMATDGQRSVDAAPEVLASPTVQRLKQTLAEALARPTVLPSEIGALEERIAVEGADVAASAQANARGWERRHALLSAEIEALTARLAERHRADLELARLRRGLEEDERLLVETQARLASVRAGEVALLPDAIVVSPASAHDRARFPQPLPYAVGALFLALLVGAATNTGVLVRDARRLVLG